MPYGREPGAIGQMRTFPVARVSFPTTPERVVTPRLQLIPLRSIDVSSGPRQVSERYPQGTARATLYLRAVAQSREAAVIYMPTHTQRLRAGLYYAASRLDNTPNS